LRENPLDVIEMFLDQLPSAVSKVKNAPKKHRAPVAAREALRIAGYVKLGPAWALGERLVRLFKRRRKRG
jgi:hypothetical protein